MAGRFVVSLMRANVAKAASQRQSTPPPACWLRASSASESSLTARTDSHAAGLCAEQLREREMTPEEKAEAIDKLAESISKLCHAVIRRRLGQFFEVIEEEMAKRTRCGACSPAEFGGPTCACAAQETSPAPAERTVWTKTSDSDPYCIHCGRTWDMHICDGRSSCPTSNRRNDQC